MCQKVLVVDDNEPLLAVLGEVFRTQGFEVIAAPSAGLALDVLHQETPDAIVCDIMMPEVDGLDFYRQVARHPEWNTIPFIFLTGLSAPEEIRQAKELGCDDYMTKPFDPEDLVAVVKGKISRSQIRRTSAAKRMEEQRKRIIHTLSHEFRTPLVAVNTGSELLREQYDHLDKERVFELIESVQRGGARLQRLVEDFMTLQQIDSGFAAAAQEKYSRRSSLVDMAEYAVERVEEVIPGAESLEVELEKPDEDFAVKIYDTQIVDAVLRIISNALKFAGSEEKVDIYFEKNKNMASVVIRDRGPGLPPEVVEFAVDLFGQVNREKMEQQGCGLGLPIAAYYVTINGGTVSVFEPDDGDGGAAIKLSFPSL